MNYKLTSIVVLVLALTACGKGEAPQAGPAGKILPENARVGIMMIDWPQVVQPGAEFGLPLRIVNASTITLPGSSAPPRTPMQISVSYHWLDTAGQPIVYEGERFPLPQALAPKETRDVKIRVKAPATPNRYVLEVDVLQEGNLWFGGVGSQTARVAIDVKQ